MPGPLPRTTLAIRQRPAEGRRELHAQARCIHSAIVQLRERQFGALATFAEQRQVDPERHRSGSQRRADPQVTVRGERPFEAGADIAEVSTIASRQSACGRESVSASA